MACGSCGRDKFEYVWTSADGATMIVYLSETIVRARVARSGGTYEVRPKG